MSYVDPANGESFVFRTRKHVIAAPQVMWFNTYEARFLNLGTQDDLDSLAAGIVEFEKSLLLNVYAIDQVTISTWEPDSHPYNPLSFITQPITDGEGARAVGIGTPIDLRVCLFVKRTPIAGRIGRIFLRGSLLVGDVTSTAGVFSLNNFSEMSGNVDEAVTAGGLASNFEGGLANPTLALIGDTELTREITAFQLGGVTVVKLNHKYFDHA